MEPGRRYFVQEREQPRRGASRKRLATVIGATMYVAIFVLLMLVVVPLLSLRYGVDSRHFTTRERRTNW
jgi:hypothetical protein